MNNEKFVKDFKEICKIENSHELLLVDDGNRVTSYTYSEVYKKCIKMINCFKSYNVTPGDSIVVILPNSAEAAIVFFASLMYGVNYAPLPCTVTQREYYNWLGIVNPKFVVRKREIAEYESDMTAKIAIETDGSISFLDDFSDCLECKENEDSSNIFLMTSGTTGTPKAMSIDADKLWNSGKAFAEFHSLVDKRCRFWNYLPMSYLGGLFNLTLIPLYTHGSIVISEPFSGKTILNFWNFVEQHSIDSLWFVPSIVSGLLKISKLIGRKQSNYSDKIHTAFLGTAPIKLEQKQEFETTFNIHLLENFALSETTFITSEKIDNIRYREESSVGHVLPYVKVKLKPIGIVEKVNEIWVSTPFLFNGYLSDEGDLQLETDQEGYFNTKDLGYLNEDGELILCGRDRDIIKKGGLFVSLVEIEHIVNSLDFVEDAVAVPVKHDFYGESYYLYVIFQTDEDPKLSVNRLHLWLLENLVNYKNPDRIIAVSEFPRTASGKIQKQQLLSAPMEE